MAGIFCVTLAVVFSGAAKAEEAPRFDIDRYEVEGNSLLAASRIEQIVHPYVGKQKDFGDVQQALEALEAAYRNAGYGTVQVTLPEQKLERGIIHFKIIEARIGKIVLEGNKYHDEANILRSLPALHRGATPNSSAVAANLRVANESTVKQTQVILKATDQEGEIDAVVKVVDEKPWKAFVTLDNTGTKQTGISRLGIGYQNGNIGNLDHVLTLQYTTSIEKPSEVGIYGAGYRIPLYNLGDSVELYGGYSDVNSGVVSGLFTVSGKGATLGARYNHNLDRRDTYQHKISVGLDYRAYQNSAILLGGGTSSLVPDYTVHPLSLTYSGQWQRPTMRADAYLTVLRNIPGGSKGGDADLNASRTGAGANYTILRLGGNYARQLDNDWQTRAAFSAQYAAEPLVAGEQFGLGGASSVRGFVEREIANDIGYRTSLELYTPDFGKLTRIDKANLRALMFYDFGRTLCRQPCGSPSGTPGSIGLGLRFNLGKEINAGLDYAYVIDPAGAQGRGDEMLHFNLGMVY